MPHDEALAQRARSYCAQTLQAACGPGGLLVGHPRFDTRRPFEADVHHPGHRYIAEAILDDHWAAAVRPTVADWLCGENTLWATGWFLWSQILRYRVTADAEALDNARQCFRDLHRLFRLCDALEPGLLGKPHGGRAGVTTSFDQSACPVVFYATFARELGTDAERDLAAEDLCRHGDYYLRRDWEMNIFGFPQRIVDPPPSPSTMKYLACVWAAWQATGEPRFHDAALRHMRDVLKLLPWPSVPFPVSHNLYYWSLLFELWRETEIGDQADWDGWVAGYWRASLAALDGEGLIRFGTWDPDAGAFTPYASGWVTRELTSTTDPRLGGKWGLAPVHAERKWISATALFNRPLVSAMTAALGLLAADRGLDEGTAKQAAARTLVRMDDETLRWWYDDGSLPEELRGLLNVFSPETAALWQVAYWMGRQQHAW